MFLFYFSLLVLADTQKLGLKQQLRNLEKQLNDLKVSSAICTVCIMIMCTPDVTVVGVVNFLLLLECQAPQVHCIWCREN